MPAIEPGVAPAIPPLPPPVAETSAATAVAARKTNRRKWRPYVLAAALFGIGQPLAGFGLILVPLANRHPWVLWAALAVVSAFNLGANLVGGRADLDLLAVPFSAALGAALLAEKDSQLRMVAREVVMVGVVVGVISVIAINIWS